MRIWTGLLGGLAIAGALALSGPPASAQDWCGFHQKAGSQVKCGFSSLQQCKQALSDKKDGDKTVTCLPDPAFG
jgi:hypothetical protein